MNQEEAIKGIRNINISLAEREFKAKPIYAYDVFISEKEYAEMLANEKKSLRNWTLQIWYYLLYFARLAYKSVSIALSIIFVMLFFSFIIKCQESVAYSFQINLLFILILLSKLNA